MRVEHNMASSTDPNAQPRLTAWPQAPLTVVIRDLQSAEVWSVEDPRIRV